ncbi:hypothetical protein K6W38_15195 [Burkholderia contaminans]|nr:hypothetical protein [Burkholderia contaminans]
MTNGVFAPALPMNDPDEPISACTGTTRPLIVLLQNAFRQAALAYTSVRFDSAWSTEASTWCHLPSKRPSSFENVSPRLP